MKFARFENSGNISYGIVENEDIIEIDSNPILGTYNKLWLAFGRKRCTD